MNPHILFKIIFLADNVTDKVLHYKLTEGFKIQLSIRAVIDFNNFINDKHRIKDYLQNSFFFFQILNNTLFDRLSN